MPAPQDPPFYPELVDPAAMLKTLAVYYGISEEVESALTVRGNRPPALHERGLGYILAQTRSINGLKLPEIAHRVQISRSQLSYYENGKQKNPGLRTLSALAYGYGLPFMLVLLAAVHDLPSPRGDPIGPSVEPPRRRRRAEDGQSTDPTATLPS